MNIDKDAFSSGQISSKIWLCEELEKLFDKIDSIWIYGGWYGLTAFLLRSRNNIEIQQIRSIDVDPRCEPIADMINENWVWKDWSFKAITKDCEQPDFIPIDVDLVINTSTEHFKSLDWFYNIPKGTSVVLQGADMKHEDHIFHFNNLSDFLSKFPLTETYFSGEKIFQYPDWKFSRFMVIGVK